MLMTSYRLARLSSLSLPSRSVLSLQLQQLELVHLLLSKAWQTYSSGLAFSSFQGPLAIGVPHTKALSPLSLFLLDFQTVRSLGLESLVAHPLSHQVFLSELQTRRQTDQRGSQGHHLQPRPFQQDPTFSYFFYLRYFCDHSFSAGGALYKFDRAVHLSDDSHLRDRSIHLSALRST